MADREKVIKWLAEEAVEHEDEEVRDLAHTALLMLEEQEPRVMTLKELQAIETPWERNTPPYFWMENRVGGGSFWVRWPNILYAMIWHKIYGNRTYGSEWRVWNLKPTPKQMRETPWEGEKE